MYYYRIFKTDFTLEKYIIEYQTKVSIPFARYRAANIRKQIEKERWDNIKRFERYCSPSHSTALSDEFHYVLESRCNIFTKFLDQTCKHRKIQTINDFFERDVHTTIK